MSCPNALNSPDRSKGVVQKIAPMGKHIEDNAAAIFLPVIPRWPLRGYSPITFENPVAEIAAHRENLSEESRLHQSAHLTDARKKQLVLYHAVQDTGPFRRFGNPNGAGCVYRKRLLAVDVLPGSQRVEDIALSHNCCTGIEINRIIFVLQCRS